ncbi:class I SAM-dependent methyltransferase [Rubellimicrobium aerolatum]|uniref:Class I SAM-dependent methyltransferase n=1 Tax=Rubellimicrobium aerolatum TaxID=490979 RepID=A0ABW0SGF5_9RHOB|nr:class I SAM-dependent methyltransferase [Rubellimicrobium aerolatum]MBP1807416.1 SAM-dependent methyltransferase [Rubellimicrobium aerolatum]
MIAQALLDACARGDLPPNVLLLRLAMVATAPEEVAAALDAAGPRLAAARALWRANPQAFGLVKSVLAGVEHAESADPAHWARVFDRLAAAAPEGGVALYALGNPDLLRAATREVVDRILGWDLLPPEARVVEIGCGIGRVLATLAPHAAGITGLDVSPGMIAAARDRCAGLPNVTLAVTSGRDLPLPDASADLVLAADVFPYLVDSGLAEAHLAESARVLRPGGHLLILNHSYRGDPDADRADLAVLAPPNGLRLRRAATGDFALWDAATFLLSRAG